MSTTEERLAKNREYYKSNREKILAKNREYYHKNRENILAKKKTEYVPQKNKEPSEVCRLLYEKYYKDKTWHCDVCDKDIKRYYKAKHCKTKKHIRNQEKQEEAASDSETISEN